MPKHQPSRPGPACARLLHDEAEALAGYPVEPLIQDWLTRAADADIGMDEKAGRLLRELLQHWTAELERQLRVEGESGSLALEHGHQRTRATHLALCRLLSLVEQSMATGDSVPAVPGRFIAPIASSIQPPPTPKRQQSRRVPDRATERALAH